MRKKVDLIVIQFQSQMKLTQPNQKEAHKCIFSLHIIQATSILRFPCSLFVQWRSSNGKQVSRQSKTVQKKGQVTPFNENLTLQTHLLFDQITQRFLQKKTSITLKLLSRTRPNQPKSVGRVTVDLAEITSTDKYTQDQEYPLEYCSVNATLKFSVVLSSITKLTAQDLQQFEHQQEKADTCEEQSKDQRKAAIPQPKTEISSATIPLQSNTSPKETINEVRNSASTNQALQKNLSTSTKQPQDEPLVVPRQEDISKSSANSQIEQIHHESKTHPPINNISQHQSGTNTSSTQQQPLTATKSKDKWEQTQTAMDYAFLHLGGGPHLLRTCHVLNTFKFTTALYVYLLMSQFNNHSTAMWLYLCIHGGYGMLWVVKDLNFPDQRFQQRQTILSSLLLSLFLGVYWIIPIPLAAGYSLQQPSTSRIFFVVGCFICGLVLMLGSDYQKYVTLRQRKGLISSGFFKYTRNPNYLGQTMIYASFAIAAPHCLSFLILFGFTLPLFAIMTTLKDKSSLMKKEGWEQYHKRSYLILPKIFQSLPLNFAFYSILLGLAGSFIMQEVPASFWQPFL